MLVAIAWFIFALIAAFTFAALIDVWQSSKSDELKLLWTIALVAVPVLGLGLYVSQMVRQRSSRRL